MSFWEQKSENEIPQTENMFENEVPSVNKRKKTNKLITVAGFIFILGMAGALIVAANKDGNLKQKPKKNEAVEDKTMNALPPLNIDPELPAPSQPEPLPIKPVKVTKAGEVPPVKMGQYEYEDQGYGRQGGAGQQKTGQSWLDRKRSAFSNNSGHQGVSAPEDQGTVRVARPDCLNGECEKKTEFAAQMEPTITKGVSASLLPDRNFLITKGTTIPCVLETAIDSTLPGIITCRVTRDIYSDNGQVLLIDRGSMAVGEYQSGIKTGQARLFALWNRIKTPNGVVVALNSPSADALGRSGMDGNLDTKFADRFGAAILISLIKDGSQALAESAKARPRGNNVVNNFGNTTASSEKMVEKALESSVNIPPTLTKNQGDLIQIMVARDLDFSTVYDLKLRK